MAMMPYVRKGCMRAQALVHILRDAQARLAGVLLTVWISGNTQHLCDGCNMFYVFETCTC